MMNKINTVYTCDMTDDINRMMWDVQYLADCVILAGNVLSVNVNTIVDKLNDKAFRLDSIIDSIRKEEDDDKVYNMYVDAIRCYNMAMTYRDNLPDSLKHETDKQGKAGLPADLWAKTWQFIG